MFSTYVVNFDATGSLFNVLTKNVSQQQGAEQFLKLEQIGEEKYQKFVT